MMRTIGTEWSSPIAIPDRELEHSPLGISITRDGHTVTVHIYRFADTEDE